MSRLGFGAMRLPMVGEGSEARVNRELAIPMMRYAFEQLRLHRITLYVHEFNERAIGVYERCGFKHEGRLREAHFMDGKYTDVLIMGLLREDFGL